MRIAIDARMYGTKQRGIGRYLMKLIEELEQEDLKNEYTIFLRKENFEEYQPKNPHFKKALWDAPWYGLKEQLFFKALKNIKTKEPKNNRVLQFLCPSVLAFDLTHFPHWNIPLFFNRPFIVTIHDLELFSSNRTRENSTRGRLTYWIKFQAFKIIFRHAVLAARGIIVPSNYVREQLLDLYPKARKKVKVIYEAPTLSARVLSVPKNLETEEQKNNKVFQFFSSSVLTSRRYVLYVGAAYPHKNLPRLLEAWALVHKEFPDQKLVLVGREDFFWKRLKAELFPNQSSALNNVIFYGQASDEELAALYQNASLLIQPSLEEGFSLSPLEALSFGCACAVSDIPVHREIYGAAVRYFDPLSSVTMAEVLKKTLKDRASDPLPREYSWRSNALETKTLYEAQKKV